ncbi:MAG: cytochrome P450, partial [Terrimicrobiaceae bacterium]
TVIHSITSVLAYLARHPEALDYLRQDPKRIVLASEEFFRVASPITHLGRVCPVDTDVHGVTVKAGDRISLCWASANRDESVFEAPDEVRLDRKPNPHVAFGFGPHLCLGAPHARLIVRTLLQRCIDRVAGIRVLGFDENVENQTSYQRISGYKSLTISLTAIDPPNGPGGLA